MSVPLAVEGMDALALAQEGERLCRENSMKSGLELGALILSYRTELYLPNYPLSFWMTDFHVHIVL